MSKLKQCPVCDLLVGQIKSHLKSWHGYVYTKESPNLPVKPKEQTTAKKEEE